MKKPHWIKKSHHTPLTLLGMLALVPFVAPSELLAEANADLTWTTAKTKSGVVGNWIRNVMMVIMAIFIMVSIVLGSLAFKQLAADGNWKDFWSKIAGAIGMFIVPVVVYYLVGTGNDGTITTK